MTFSAPMLPGTVGSQVRLISIRNGDMAELGDQERWDASRTRLTFELAGAPPHAGGTLLREGEHYVLEIGADVLAADGGTLERAVRFPFLASAPDWVGGDLADWKVVAPEPGTLDPIVVAFPRPMDVGTTQPRIRVMGPEGRALAGTGRASPNMTSWQWKPSRAWSAGHYAIQVDRDLRDISGNRVRMRLRASESSVDARPVMTRHLVIGTPHVHAPQTVAPGASPRAVASLR